MMPKVKSALPGVLFQVSRKLLFAGTCMLVGCSSTSSISGNGDSGEVSEDGAEPSMEIAFTDELTDPLFARARTDNGDEFAVFVDRADDGEASALRELATQLADGTVVTAIADETGRPVRFEDGTSSVAIIFRTSDAVVVYTDPTGLTSETVVALPAPTNSAVKAGVALQAGDADLLCDELLANYMATVAVVFDCSDMPESPLCSSVIAQAARASQRLCSDDALIVPDDQLETEIATDPEMLGVGTALSVVAVADTRNESGQTVLVLDAVAAGGTGPYTIAWEVTDGPVSPIIPDGASTEVVLTTTGVYTIIVTATDSDGESVEGTVVVDAVVDTTTGPLMADAGSDRTLAPGVAVVLEGSATGGDGDYVYQWSPTTALSDPSTAGPTLTLDEAGTYTYTLTVTDGDGNTDSDSTTIIVIDSLVAEAGPDVTVAVGQAVVLEGSAIGGVGDYVYEWSPATGLSDPNVAQPTLTSDEPGTFTYTLTVTDGEGTEASDSTTVMVAGPLTVDAGPDVLMDVGQTVVLEGSATGGDGDYTYVWSPATGLSNPNVAQPTLTSDEAGTFPYMLTVTDGMGDEASDSTTVVVIVGPLAAQAGSDRAVTLGQAVTLDGSASGGDANYSYEWSPTTGLSDATVAQPILSSTDIGVGTVEFTLTATDGTGATASDAVTVTVSGNAPPPPLAAISSVKWGANFSGAGYQVLVEFSEGMQESSAETTANYRINGTATNPSSATLGADGKTVTLVFGAAMDTADSVDISLGGSIQDQYARAISEALNQTIAANGESTAPTISSITWANGYTTDGYQAIVTFNESMDETTAETVANYDVNNGADDAPTTAALATDGRTVTLTWATGDLTNPLDGSDTFDISLLSSITDINAQTLTAQAAQAVTAHASDSTAPTISTRTYGSEATSYIAIVTFNESLDESTAETAANYDINNGDDAAPNSAVLASDGKTVTLTWTAAELTQPWAIADTMDISISNTITDINAQALTAAAGSAIAANGADSAGPANPTVAHAGAAVDVVLTFDEVMDEATTEVGTFTSSSVPTQSGNAVLSDDGRTLTVTFTADPGDGAGGETITIPNTSLLDINGNTYAGATLTIPN